MNPQSSSQNVSVSFSRFRRSLPFAAHAGSPLSFMRQHGQQMMSSFESAAKNTSAGYNGVVHNVSRIASSQNSLDLLTFHGFLNSLKPLKVPSLALTQRAPTCPVGESESCCRVVVKEAVESLVRFGI